MANEDAIQNLRNTLDDLRENTGVKELRRREEKIQELHSDFKKSRTVIQDDARQLVYRAMTERDEEKATVDNRWTFKNMSVYHYSSTTEASMDELVDLADNYDLLEVLQSILEEAYEKKQESLSDKVKTNFRVLIPDDRDFDAAKYTLPGRYGNGPSLVDLKNTRECSGDSIKLEKEMRQKQVKEIVKTARYVPEIREVMQEAEEALRDAISDNQTVITDLTDALDEVEG